MAKVPLGIISVQSSKAMLSPVIRQGPYNQAQRRAEDKCAFYFRGRLSVIGVLHERMAGRRF